MPFISDTQLARVQNRMASMQAAAVRGKKKAAEKVGQMKTVGEIMGGAAAVGFLRGKMEDKSTGAWNIPGTTFDAELAIGAGAVGAALFELFGKYDEDVINVGSGILAHYSGQIARKWGRTGSFPGLVAGSGGRANPALVGATANANEMLRSALSAM